MKAIPLKIAWLFFCCLVLGVTLYSYSPGQNSDIGILFAWAMLALSFPSGLAVAGLISLLSMLEEQANLPLLGSVPPVMGFVIAWLMFCAIGYWQWFKVIPWLLKKLRRSEGHTISRS